MSYVQAVGVSAMTGEGMDELFEAVQEAREEYLTDYKPQLDAVVAERVRLISFSSYSPNLSMLSLKKFRYPTGEEEEFRER